MSTPHLPGDLPDVLAANREELRRRSRAERVHSIWLWIGILAGPLAFLVVRLASIVLLDHHCGRAAQARFLGMSSPQLAIAGITLLGAVVTVAAGLRAWQIWRFTSLPEDEVSNEEMPRVPFWALGGILVSAFCLLGIAITGGM